MTYDWNWFFSSFSQCAAALIGIIGAFVISRLLGLSEKVNLISSNFRSLQITYTNICELIGKRDFYGYTKNSVRYSSKINSAMLSDEYKKLKVDELIEKVITDNPDLFKLKDAIAEGINEIKFIQHPRHSEVRGGLDLYPNGLKERLWNEKEAINNLEIASRTSILKFSNNYDELESLRGTITHLKVIIIYLMVAFILTVIYPLHFMPIYEKQAPILIYNPIVILRNFSSLNNWMLVIFFIVINSIFGYFLYLISQLKSKLSLAIAEHSDEYQNIKSYSEYFED